MLTEESVEELKVKSAPSENWQEVVGLWQCHDEKYEQFFDPITKQLKIPQNTLLHSLNTLQVSEGVLASSIKNSEFTNIQGMKLIECM